jgi:hypothetical protein
MAFKSRTLAKKEVLGVDVSSKGACKSSDLVARGQIRAEDVPSLILGAYVG